MPPIARLAALAVLAALPLAGIAQGGAAPAAAGAWPSKPVRLIVTFPPGGSTDAVVRVMVPRLAERLGQQVVVDNRPGAGGNIGLQALAQSAPDGYTIGVGAAGGLAANASLYPKMPFDVQKDFVPISLLAHIPFVLVVPPNSPLKSVADLVAQAKAEPGKVAVGHGGNGTAMHLSVQLMKLMAGVEMTEVAYKGSGPVALDVMGGQVPAGMLDLPSVLQQIKAGKVRALAVTGATPPAAAAGGADALRRPASRATSRPAGSAWSRRGDAARGRGPAAGRDARRPHRSRGDRRCPRRRRRAQPDELGEFGRFIASETVKWADVIKRSGTKLD
jgi:tripartite-type tricarboxylate transporter receptor subunit TctC